ncbi:fatty acid-binding protein-like [Pollicipes pollicipes]|uniref:fatty acid-binding protein-like n=1 Tax=Pollicipes pollicipes TaxID=41117 RepID=UPI001884959A|nr:fatty acid-binding protein-like [Pollicipes pollicipes]
MASVVGTYQHEKSENLDAFFSAIGVPWIPRKMMTNSNPTVQVSQDGETYTIRTVSAMKTVEITFKVDEAFESSLMSGEKTQNVIRKEGDSLIQEQDSSKGKIIITRAFSENAMDMTMEHKTSNVKATRHFKRTA